MTGEVFRTRDDVRAEFVTVYQTPEGTRAYVYPSEAVCEEIMRLRKIETAAIAISKGRRVSPERMAALRQALWNGQEPTP